MWLAEVWTNTIVGYVNVIRNRMCSGAEVVQMYAVGWTPLFTDDTMSALNSNICSNERNRNMI